MLIREPLPKEFVMEAWKARVGCDFERWRTQDAYSGTHQQDFYKL